MTARGRAAARPYNDRVRILLIEDSERLRLTLQAGLKKAGFAVDGVADGVSGLSYAKNNPYDVVVLDLMLPGLDGISLLKELRKERQDTHVLILSARDTVEDRVEGLKAGADDYLVKPFAFAELVARIQALVRRKYGQKSPRLELGTLTIDEAAGTVTQGARSVDLTPREYSLLEYLARREGETVTRFEIEDAIYDEHNLPQGNALHTAVCRLRAKLEVFDGAPRIETLRKRGYRLVVPNP